MERGQGVAQADGSMRQEPTFDREYAAQEVRKNEGVIALRKQRATRSESCSSTDVRLISQVVHIAEMPLSVNGGSSLPFYALEKRAR